MDQANLYNIMLCILAITYTNAVNEESFFHVSRNVIINTTDDSILSTHITLLPLYCVWYCMRNEDCFAVNTIPRQGRYVCELLPVLVDTYDIITSADASYYRKPCLFEADEKINDAYTIGVQYVLFREEVNCETAIQSCKTHNMKLIALETQAEFNLITSTFSNTDFWVAAYEIGSTDVFKWINHSVPFEYYHSAWAQGQPNSWQGEHCVRYAHNAQGYHDIPCDHLNFLRNYVCECPYLNLI